ncbi:MAG TPA: sugar phosphate isomerase/epimerase [Chloroflexota bacterium]|nr:sugar phosphate isomerase/epimerase [Chloroflexota bacterium]
MKLGAFTINFYDQPFEQALQSVRSVGCEMVEIGCGGFIGKRHCDPAALLADDRALRQFQDAIAGAGLQISALSCHMNALHPDPAIGEAHRRDFRETILLAERLGVERVITFAGCPGDSETARFPNWVTCTWPDYFKDLIAWQWEQKVIPFWREEVAFARAHGIHKICLEMHPGDVVYSPEKLLRLREAVGETIGCNFDPSHLFWQGIDPVAAVRLLGDVIYHVHAKDSRVDPQTVNRVGVLDTKPYADEANRSWIFRTVGYGHGTEFWKALVSELRLIGYDDVLSIEHEDSLFSGSEGMAKAADLLRQVMPHQPRGAMWWD